MKAVPLGRPSACPDIDNYSPCPDTGNGRDRRNPGRSKERTAARQMFKADPPGRAAQPRGREPVEDGLDTAPAARRGGRIGDNPSDWEPSGYRTHTNTACQACRGSGGRSTAPADTPMQDYDAPRAGGEGRGRRPGRPRRRPARSAPSARAGRPRGRTGRRLRPARRGRGPARRTTDRPPRRRTRPPPPRAGVLRGQPAPASSRLHTRRQQTAREYEQRLQQVAQRRTRSPAAHPGGEGPAGGGDPGGST